MKIIAHRVNTIEKLKNIPNKFGIEVDIRSEGQNLIMHHDPFSKGEDFDNWLSFYNHEILILNVKEEGLEERLISMMSTQNIKNFFFLDQSFPFLIKTSRKGEKRSAIRLSEYENIQTVINLKGQISWVWVDCFTEFPLDKDKADFLQKECGYKLCFVSPELQGRDKESDIINFKKNLKLKNINGDAVCTKYPNLWA